MNKVMLKEGLDQSKLEDKLEDLGYIFSPIEGGYISPDTATIVNIYRSPYQREVFQFKASSEAEHLKNIEQLREINIIE